MNEHKVIQALRNKGYDVEIRRRHDFYTFEFIFERGTKVFDELEKIEEILANYGLNVLFGRVDFTDDNKIKLVAEAIEDDNNIL